MAEALAHHALLERHPRHVADLDRQEHHALVQHLVVVEVVQQRVRRRVGRRGEEHRGARNALRRILEERLEERRERHRGALQALEHDLAPAPPGGEHHEHEEADHQREPAAVVDLGERGDEEREIDRGEEARREDAQRKRIAPAVADDEEGEQRVDEHRPGDRDAVGAGEARGGAEADHRGDHHRAQHPVDRRQVHLADLARRGVHDRHARQEAELDRLLGEGIGARDHRLRSDHRGGGRERDHRVERPAGKQQVERILQRLGIAHEQRALAEVVEHQRRRHQPEPGDAHRAFAEMPHVRVQRLGAGDGEHH